jgi:hypothetical protein
LEVVGTTPIYNTESGESRVQVISTLPHELYIAFLDIVHADITSDAL